jgi:hypothetical protein
LTKYVVYIDATWLSAVDHHYVKNIASASDPRQSRPRAHPAHGEVVEEQRGRSMDAGGFAGEGPRVEDKEGGSDLISL